MTKEDVIFRGIEEGKSVQQVTDEYRELKRLDFIVQRQKELMGYFTAKMGREADANSKD